MNSGEYQPLDQGNMLVHALRYQFNHNYIFTDEPESESRPVQGGIYKTPVFTVADMNNTFIDLNKSFEYVGDNSTFQKRITMILSLQWIAFTFIVMGMSYVFRSPKFKCISDNASPYICNQDVACLGDYKIDYPTQYSVIQEFGLVCVKQYLVTMAQSLFFLGGFISGYILSYLSNIIGRRSVLIITMGMTVAAVVTCAVAQSFQIFMVGYFFCGFSLFGYETQVYIYISEISAIRFRTISFNILTIVWAGAPIFFPLMNVMPSWRYLFWFFAGPLIISLPLMYKCFLESPRFLVSKGCFKQARTIFRQISITNKRPPYEFHLLQQIEYENNTLTHINSDKDRIRKQKQNQSHKKKKRTYNFLDLFRYKSLLKLTLTLMTLWLVRFFMYFSINLALESIVNTSFLLSLIISTSALVEVCGAFGIRNSLVYEAVMTTYLFHKKKIDIMKLSLLMTTIFCFSLWFIVIPPACRIETGTCPQMYENVAIIMLIKFFITVFYTGLMSYGSEIFPTDVRSLGSGFTLTFGRLGTLIVPFYINYIKLHYDKNPLSFLTPWTLIAYILCRWMPESETEGLKQHVQEQSESNVLRETEMRQINNSLLRNQSARKM